MILELVGDSGQVAHGTLKLPIFLSSVEATKDEYDSPEVL